MQESQQQLHIIQNVPFEYGKRKTRRSSDPNALHDLRIRRCNHLKVTNKWVSLDEDSSRATKTHAEEFGRTDGENLRIFAEADETTEQGERVGQGMTAGTTYMVDTPASMADESMSARRRNALEKEILSAVGYLQHCRPIRKAKSTTGAVYCPSVLYDGCVTVRAKS